MTHQSPLFRKSLFILTTALFSAHSAVVCSQVLEEIVVTAQKREQNLQDIGISITAYSGGQLKELGLADTVDLTTMTPGLQYTVPNAEGSQINFFLRGVGLNEAGDSNENPVAVYMDGVYRASISGLHMQNFDAERAEVLRGPQGTLFGRNSSGGLVHFISKRPTDQFEGFLEVGAESFDTIKSEGMINGPLTDNLSARASWATNNNSGYVKNEFTGVDPLTGGDPGDFNETDAFAGRGQLLWTPDEKGEVLLRGYYSHNRGQVGGWQNQPTTFPNIGTSAAPIPDTDNRVELGVNEVNPFCGAPTPAGTDCQGYRDTDGNPHTGAYDRDGDTAVSSYGISGEINWELANDWTLTSITSYDEVDRTQEEDTDASPNLFVNVAFYSKSEQFTQELRLAGETDKTRWQVGAYYFSWDVTNDYGLILAPGFFVLEVDAKQETDSWSLFGQVEHDISDQITLIGGVRYTEEEKTLDYSNVDAPGAGGLISFLTSIGATANASAATRPTADTMILFNKSTAGDLARHDKSSVSALLEIDWKPNDDLLVYAKYSRGVKSAGFNATFLDASGVFALNTLSNIPFDDETLTSYEAGIKATILNGTTRLNASAFYYDYEDYQTLGFDQFSTFVFNTDAEIYGGEIELQASPTESIDIILGASFLNTKGKDVPTAGTFIPRNVEMVAAPDVTLNGMARYQWPVFSGTMAAIASFYWQDDTWYDIQNFEISRANSYIVGNLRLKWTSGNDDWTVSAFVNNIADEKFITYTFDFTGPGGFNQLHYGKPRWFGGSVGYSWQ